MLPLSAGSGPLRPAVRQEQTMFEPVPRLRPDERHRLEHRLERQSEDERPVRPIKREFGLR